MILMGFCRECRPTSSNRSSSNCSRSRRSTTSSRTCASPRTVGTRTRPCRSSRRSTRRAPFLPRRSHTSNKSSSRLREGSPCSFRHAPPTWYNRSGPCHPCVSYGTVHAHAPFFAFTSHIYPACQSSLVLELALERSDLINRGGTRRITTTPRRAGVRRYLYTAHDIAESRNSYRAGWPNGTSGRRGKVHLFSDESTLCSFPLRISDCEKSLEASARGFVASTFTCTLSALAD